MNIPPSADQLFIKKLTDLVLANLAREDFDIDQLARAAGISRSALHRRLRRMKDQNASQFIREIRLLKAMEMLQQDLGTASEIAYRVGFGSPAYFTKCYHEYFGFPPGEARKRAAHEYHSTGKVEGNDKITSEAGQSYKEQGSGKWKQKKRRILIMTGIIAVPVITLTLILLFSDVFTANAGKQSILVLPFKNLSDDPGNQYFADGIREDILSNLYYISDLRVVSGMTSEHFGNTDMTSGDLARHVNVGNVLEGSIRRDSNIIRVSVQLIDAGRSQQIWSQNYDRDVTDLLGVQGEIAMKIADKLKTIITDSEATQLKKLPTQNPEAYDNYLQARFLLHKANSDKRFDISRDGLFASLQYYEKAIAADTNFADAYAGLANAWFNLSAWKWYRPFREGMEHAKHFSSVALQKDPDCAEAHAVKGAFLIYADHRFEEAKSELQIAIRLAPYYSTARQWYAQLLMITGPITEARKQVDRAVELEPYFWVVQNLNSWICYFEGEHEKGLEACSTARDLNPKSTENIWLFVLHHAKLGEANEAVSELQYLLEFFPGGEKYADEVREASERDGVQGIFMWLVDVNKNKPLPVEGLNGHPFFISWWYAIAGDRELSLAWLERTLDEEVIPRHYFNLITTNPDFDLIRADPRFHAVLEKEGLARYNRRAAQ
jgi:TolB-like protein/AraC-like DNA-binding protein/Tfp pilus assembly protein PilF